MSITAYLEGGPWDGKLLSLSEELQVIRMFPPTEPSVVLDDGSIPMRDVKVSVLEYKFHRRLPNEPGTWVYRII